VYSAQDAVSIASEDPEREHIFLGVGFETTAPGAALAILKAGALGLANFTIYSAHKTLPAALRALLASPAGAAVAEPADVGAVEAAGSPAGARRIEGLLLPGPRPRLCPSLCHRRF
jgi:hydrogenase expression/formation protein HypD